MKMLFFLGFTLLVAAGCEVRQHHSRYDGHGVSYGGTRDHPSYQRGGYRYDNHHRRMWQDTHGHWHYEGDRRY